jgi:hypothetical protein
MSNTTIYKLTIANKIKYINIDYNVVVSLQQPLQLIHIHTAQQFTHLQTAVLLSERGVGVGLNSALKEKRTKFFVPAMDTHMCCHQFRGLH